MRKIDFISYLSLLVLGMAIFIFNSCGNASTKKENATTQEEASNNPDNQSNEAGVIVGDVIYKGVEVSRILDENPESALGTPLSSSGPIYFFDGLEIYFTEYVENIQLTNLILFKINGITLDKNRAELIEALGNPIEYYEYPDYIYRDSDDDRMIRYHVSSYIADYMLDFWFENPGEKANICGVRRIGQ